MTGQAGRALQSSEPQSLGQLALAKGSKVSKSVLSTAVLLGSTALAVLAKHKYAIGSSAAIAIGTHLFVASMMMGVIGDKKPTVSAGGCTAATNFLARTSLAGGDVTNYTTLICGLVTDGIITGDLSGARGCGTKLDLFYVLGCARCDNIAA